MFERANTKDEYTEKSTLPDRVKLAVIEFKKERSIAQQQGIPRLQDASPQTSLTFPAFIETDASDLDHI